MAAKTNNSKNYSKREGWLLLVVAALILLLFFFKLFNVLWPELEKAAIALSEHRAIKLERGIDKETLKKIIEDGNYYTDSRDIDLLVDSLSQKLLYTNHL